MSMVMYGAEVAKSMKESLLLRVEALKKSGIHPCLAIVRVGEQPEDLSYERGAIKRMEMLGILCKVFAFPQHISQEALETEFQKLNEDEKIHGILMFRPLPEHLKEEPFKEMIHPDKDVDCMSLENFGKVFCSDETGYAPCTAEAVMKMLEHYQVPLEGKHVVMVGRSMVVGKPLSVLMLQKHSTVTVAHSRTTDLADICQKADVLVAAVGKPRMITANMVRENAVVVDVGINVDEQGNLCGDVDYEQVEKKTSYISPVPRGVGSVTTSVLAEHVIRAAELRKKV